MDTVTWPLYKKHGHAFEAFKLIGQDPNSVLGELTKTVTRKTESGEEVTETVPAVIPEMREAFVVNIRRRMTPTPLKIRADVELTCFSYDGVLHIKARAPGRFSLTSPETQARALHRTAPSRSLLMISSDPAQLGALLPQESMRAGESASRPDVAVKMKLVRSC